MSRAHAQTPPREPLTFANAGLYGGWSEYAVSPESPFDYLIIQAIVLDDHIEWNGFDAEHGRTWDQWLALARAAGKRVIADVVPAAYDADGRVQSIQSFYHDPDPLPLERFLPLFDKFFAEVDERELYAITLSEEHVHWNRQAEHLNAMYDYVKARYDVPVFQWYTPAAWVPGFSEWPNLRADGWVSDEYFLRQPEMEQYVRGFMLQRKPFVHIVWAAPDCASVPWDPEVFAVQMAVCRKYGVAPSFFTWAGSSGLWGWSDTSPAPTREVFEAYCVATAEKDQRETYTVDTTRWDEAPTSPNWIMLRCDPESRPVMGYHDDFARVSHVKLLDDTALTGFADLRWDSSPLQLCPRNAGPATASVTWRFESPLPMHSLRVTVQGAVTAEQNGSVSLRVEDESGQSLGSATLDADGVGEVLLSEPSARRFLVTATMTGDASTAGRVVAEIAGLSVEADIAATNRAKPIVLTTDTDGGVVYEDDFRNLTILHTAHDIVCRTAMTLQPGWLYCTSGEGIDRFVEVVQMFRVDKPIRLDGVWVKGMGNTPEDRSRIGVAVSLDGVNKVAESFSDGVFDGRVALDTSDVAELAGGVNDFYVHLRMEADDRLNLPERSGVRAYGLRGRAVAGQ